MHLKNFFLFVFFGLIFILLTQQAHAAPMIYRVQQMQAMKKQQAQEAYQAEYQQYQQNEQSSQPQSQQLSPAEAYQQSVDERNQSIAQAIVKANGQSVSVAATGSVPSSGGQESPSGVMPQGFSNSSQGAGDTVDLTEVWKKLDNKSAIWTALDDDQAKVMTVSEYISRFQKEGVKINEPPEHYVQMIDQMSQQNPPDISP